MTASEGRYALRHVDTAGAMHQWTCGPAWAHWVARWLARDSGCLVTVLRDDGDGWVEVAVWTPVGEAANHDWVDDGDTYDDQHLEVFDHDMHDGGEPDEPQRRPIIDYVVL